MLKNYFKIALRNILKYKTTSLINILGLAIGMAACILITIYLQYELSYDKFNTNADRIYRLIETYDDPKFTTDTGTPFAAGPAIKANVPDFPFTARITGYKPLYTFSYGNKMFKEDKVRIVDPDILNMFSFEFIRGSKEHALTEPNSIIINEEIAARYFGNENPVGKMIKAGPKYLTVTGVIKKMPPNSSIEINAMVSMSTLQEENKSMENHWFNNLAETYLLAQSGLTVPQLEEKIYAASIIHFSKEERSKIAFRLQPLKRIHLYSRTDFKMEEGGDYSIILIYGLLALFILFIACINFTNLSIGRLSTRFKEIGIRKLLGAEKKQILSQFWGEMAVLSLIAFVIAIILAGFYLPYFSEITHSALSYSLTFWNILFFIAIFLMTCFIAGAFPALLFARYQSAAILRGGIKLSGSNTFSKSLIVLQYALSLFFIICTSIMSGQIGFIFQNHRISDDEKIIRVNYNSIYMTDKNGAGRKVFFNEISNSPMIKMSAEYPGGGYVGNIEYEGRKWIGGINPYNERYSELFGIRIVSGRNYDFAKYPSDSLSSAIISKSFAEDNNIINPFGKTIKVLGKDYSIIGIVEDQIYSLKKKALPEIYTNSNLFIGGILCRVKNENIQPALQMLKDKWLSIFPGTIFNYVFLDDDIKDKYAQELTARKLLSIVSAITLLISSFGIFGLTTLSIAKRTKEIGIRKALGASAGRIIFLLTREMLLLIAIAAVIASPFAYYYMSNWLNDYYYRINITALYFVSAIAITVIVTLLIVGIKTAKAALANPVESLRYE